MFTPCDLLKALINGCRAWRVMGAIGGHYRDKIVSSSGREVYIWHRKILAHNGLLTARAIEGKVPL